jgi:hypothetical protein
VEENNMHEERQERRDSRGVARTSERARTTPTWDEIYQVLRERGWLPEFGARLPEDDD